MSRNWVGIMAEARTARTMVISDGDLQGIPLHGGRVPNICAIRLIPPQPPEKDNSHALYALYIVSKNASATCPTIVDPTGLDWPSPVRERGVSVHANASLR